MQITMLAHCSVFPMCCCDGSKTKQGSHIYVQWKCAVWTAMMGIQIAKFYFILFIFLKHIQDEYSTLSNTGHNLKTIKTELLLNSTPVFLNPINSFGNLKSC